MTGASAMLSMTPPTAHIGAATCHISIFFTNQILSSLNLAKRLEYCIAGNYLAALDLRQVNKPNVCGVGTLVTRKTPGTAAEITREFPFVDFANPFRCRRTTNGGWVRFLSLAIDARPRR